VSLDTGLVVSWQAFSWEVMQITRKQFMGVGASAVAVAGLSACSPSESDLGVVAASASLKQEIELVEAGRYSSGISRRFDLTAALSKAEIDKVEIQSHLFNQSLVGPEIRASFGDQVSVSTQNDLSQETSVHFHGLALRNDMDGVPMLTQDAIATGASLNQSFKAPHPGTYWYHSHSLLQQDEGLMGPLVIDDPKEPLSYDSEWVVLLDDWSVGLGRSVEENLSWLKANSTGGHGMGMMGGTSLSGQDFGLGASDLIYDRYLVNGKTKTSPEVMRVAPGDKVRIRIINGASDTAFVVYLEGHELQVVAADGFPVVPKKTKSLIIGMGERYDVLVTASQAANLVAVTVGKNGDYARAVMSPNGNAIEFLGVNIPGVPLEASSLNTQEEFELSTAVDATHDLNLQMSMQGYIWAINGGTDYFSQALTVKKDTAVKLRFVNNSMMFHPMHLHGHSFQVSASNGRRLTSGARKDTLIVKPMEIAEVIFVADNPGDWAIHCHNSYHMEAGMVTSVNYGI